LCILTPIKCYIDYLINNIYQKYYNYCQLRGYQIISALFVLSLWPTHNMDKTHLHKIIFFMFLRNLREKLPITKIIEDNIFEGMRYRFYILLLFDFIFELK